MPTDPLKRRVWPTIFAGVVLGMSAVAYVIAYDHSIAFIKGDFSASPVRPYPIYERSGMKPFFAPAHWLDRRIRPHVWEPTP